MSQPDPHDAKERRSEVQGLLDRCRTIEKELAALKQKLEEIQKSVEEGLRKRSGGSSLKGHSARLARTRIPWSPQFVPRGRVAQLR